MADIFETKPNNFGTSKSITKYLDHAGLISFWGRVKDYVDNQDLSLFNLIKDQNGEIADLKERMDEYDAIGGGSNIQPDWNNNTPGAPGYIKNRTHYIDYTTINSYSEQSIPGYIEKPYTVSFNGGYYTLVEGENRLSWGPPMLIHVAYGDDSGSIRVDVSSYLGDDYPLQLITSMQKLPSIYLPSSMPADGGNADTVDNKHASDFVLKAGDTMVGNLTMRQNDGGLILDQANGNGKTSIYMKPNGSTASSIVKMQDASTLRLGSSSFNTLITGTKTTIDNPTSISNTLAVTGDVTAPKFKGDLQGTATKVSNPLIIYNGGDEIVYDGSGSRTVNLVLIPGSGEGTGMMNHGTAEVDGDYSVSFGYNSFNGGLISLTSGSKTEANADLTHAEGYDTKAGRIADIIDINSCTIDLAKASARKAEIAELLNIAVEEGLISYDGTFDESNVLDYITNNHDTVIRYFGIGAHVEGKESQALGTASHAEGELTQANGNASHAEGKNTIASGHESHAEGQDTRARGHQSHAEGIATVASGTNAHAEGDSTKASGYASHAEGISTIASGTNTHAEGELTRAIGNDSHAEGYGTQATGNQSHAEGDSTQAIGNDSHAGGNGSIAEGDRSFAHGDAVQAKGANALALGKNSIATGHNSIAAGHESQTNNTRSFAMGYICSTGGNDSMAFGYECSTGAAKSAAIGNRAKTTNVGEFACGSYNATSSTQLFSVGCGTSDTSRKNAFHVINNSGTIKAYIDNKEISVVGHTHNPSDLGLSGAMKYCGKTTTTLSDGDTTNPIVIGGSNFTAVAGNVVIDNNNHKEFIWDGSKWELLGDEGSYKIKQSVVSDPNASGTSTTFIDTISQDANGKITVTKKNIPTFPTSLPANGGNADTVDNKHASDFVLKAGDIMTGALTTNNFLKITAPASDGTPTRNAAIIRTEVASSDANKALVHIGSNYGYISVNENNTAKPSVHVDAIGIYRGVIGVGGTFTYDTLKSNQSNNISLEAVGNVKAPSFIENGQPLSDKYLRSTIYGNFDADTLFNDGFQSGYMSHLPSGQPYGIVHTLSYRGGRNNAKPDFASQIFIPNGDDSTSPNDMFFRTSLADSWNGWNKVITDNNIGSYALPITGGTINTAATTTPLNIKNTQSNPTDIGIRFMYNDDSKGWIGYDTQRGTVLYTYNGSHRLGIKDDGTAYVDSNTLIHSGNIKDQYVAGVYDSYNPLMKITFNYAGDAVTSNPTWLACWNGYTLSYVSPDNVKAGSATKLQTPRKLWGNDFDGTADVNGLMYVGNEFHIEHPTTGRQLNISPYWTILGYNNQFIGNPTYVDGRDVYIRYGNDEYVSTFASNGNVGIGTTSPTEKLDVSGNVKANGTIKAPTFVVSGSAHSATLTMENSSLKIDKELQLTTGGSADICSGIACALKADRLQAKNLISENIILGNSANGSFSNMSFNIKKYGSIASQEPATLTTLLTVNTTGNVGIGNTSPTERLDVSGNVKANGFIGNASSATVFGSSNFKVYAENSNEINFGGTGDKTNVYFGHRDKDSKAVPLNYYFGPTGGANVRAGAFCKKDSSDSYVLLGGGGHKSLSDFSKASWTTFTPAETALTNDDVLSTTGEFSLAKGSWYYAGNGYLPAGEFGNIDLAGCSVLTFGGNSGGVYTQLFITSPAPMGTNAVKSNEILFYNNHGSNYNPGWTRVLTNRNYTEYITDTNYYHTRSYSSGLQISTGTGVSNMYVPYATASQAGVVSTGSQTFAGAKTFNSTVKASAFYIDSDERLKTFGDDIKVDFDELAKLRKSHFVFNNNPTKQEIGVSAQEVQKLYPEIVNETEEGTLSVDYSKLAVVALAAIDKLNQRVQELENKLAKYE